MGTIGPIGASEIRLARLTSSLKRLAAGIRDWKEVDEDYAAGEFFAQLQGWDRERRFVVIRERIRESKEAVGRKLGMCPGTPSEA